MYFLNEAISKELLSEVLGYRVLSNILIQEEIIIKLNFEYFQTKYENDEINIYELAHKCKEWAYENGYYLTIYNDAIDIILQTNCKMVENITNGSYRYSPRLIFKACQWILDNKDK